MKIIKEININKEQKILIIEDNDSISMYILDVNYKNIDFCFATEKNKFNFSDEDLIELAKDDFDLYYQDIEILEDYWNNAK